ncbi:1,6-dihydroxycyclohexa-2,4-diene-1-carboxylate dehydrogenase [Comamonas denitrificans]|uniref:1,6-dihydroxycyclohexa-2,4-diene-1-carboxylate dehydrogenase n=1 Tax=Comamonas denitrificans TaxID=117506 RepID=A0A939GW87_9BURK|nr:1,6-dihydroxycyclohexa-2,4-diene-1-carboxylate dehydrogenase [Comamonas denitrificans]MBO1248466.1 1,6-dihydroxycyclohexa-2,4-diene-1-carboxylate dehydrogenase [Comamonas denitrificans]
MSNRFKKKVAVITGAAQGIGKRVAEKMAKEKGTLVLVDRSELVHDVAKDIASSTKVEVLSLTADLEKFAECQRIMNAAVEKFGHIDILINNVGGTIWTKPFEHYQEAEIEAEVRRSLFPTLWCCHAAITHMLTNGKGSIVNVSSIATRGINRVPYGAAKGGVNALTACLAFENGERGIRVNATAPGATEAPPRLIPRNTQAQCEQEKAWYQQIYTQSVDSSLMKRYGTLDEQADPILFLASDDASYITGTVLPVGGGDQG